MTQNIKIGIADRHKFVHDGIRLFCQHQSQNIEIIFHAYSCEEVEEYLFKNDIDILVMDVNFPLRTGVGLCEKFRKKYKDLKILVFSEYEEVPLIAKLFKSGVNCYLSKREGFDSLGRAISQVAQLGFCYLYDMNEILNSPPMHSFDDRKRSPMLHLSEKERAIIELIRKEMTTREIADTLGLHKKTVEFHKRNIIDKAGSKKILGAIDYLVSHNLVPAKSAG